MTLDEEFQAERKRDRDSWDVKQRHWIALDTQDLVRRARFCLRDVKGRPDLVDFAEIRTAQLLIEEALSHEPTRQAAE